MSITNIVDVENEFKIICSIGKGSFGEVFKATHISSNRVIALKKQPLRDDNSELMREIKIMEDLQSPYIIGYYGSTLKEGIMWIVMEFCCYGSLNDMMTITKNTFNEHQISTLCRAILEGLVYMTKASRIHRDIKPHNVLVNEKGEAKLCDFGISRDIVNGQKRKTVIGTPYYLAPEVIKEEGYDNKVDVWALGISAIEMAEFNPPLHHAHPMRVLFMIPQNPAPTLTNPEHWSKEFNNFVAKCLDKDPETRSSPSDLLSHSFIREKSGVSTLLPYLKHLDNILDKHGSLDAALRAANKATESDDESEDDFENESFNEKAMFGEFSDESLGFDPSEPFEENSDSMKFEDAIDDVEKSTSSSDFLSFSTSDSDHEEMEVDDLMEVDVGTKTSTRRNRLSNQKSKPAIAPAPTFPTIVEESPPIVAKSTLLPSIAENRIPSNPSSPQVRVKAPKVPVLSLKPTLPTITSSNKVPEIKPLSISDKVSYTEDDVLLTCRSVRTPHVKLAKKVTDTIPQQQEFKQKTIRVEDLMKPTVGSSNVSTEKIYDIPSPKIETYLAAQRRAEEISQISEKSAYDEFVRYHKSHKSQSFQGSWNAIHGLVHNPWRNNPQYKITISQPTLLCIVIESKYNGKVELESGRGFNDHVTDIKEGVIGITIFDVVDATKQIITCPRSLHTKHRWKSNASERRTIMIYLQDESKKYIIVPTISKIGRSKVNFKMEILHPSDVNFSLDQIQPVPITSMYGELTKATSGGTVDGIEWRRNPQYLLHVTSTSATVSVFLAQLVLDKKQRHSIGFYLIKVPENQNEKLLNVEFNSLVVKEQGWLKASEVTTAPIVLEKGSYIVLPCTFYPNCEAKFLLSVLSYSEVKIGELKTTHLESAHHSKWTPGLDGGCLQYEGWIDNPRFHLVLESDSNFVFFVDRKPWSKKQPKEFVGVYIFRAKPHRYATLTKERLVAKTKYFSDSKEVMFTPKTLKKGNYIIMVTTFEPNKKANFILRAYSTRPFNLNPLPPYTMVTCEDSWTEDNAGGAFNYGSWRKNPQYFIMLERSSTNVEILLSQEPLSDMNLGVSSTSTPLLPSAAVKSDKEDEVTFRIPKPRRYPCAGFYAFKAPCSQPEKMMKVNKGDVLKITEFQTKRLTTWATKLSPNQPIIIMPTPLEPNCRNKYNLSIVGVNENEVVFKKIKDKNKMYSHSTGWSEAQSTTGGCTNFSLAGNEQWLDNPQILIACKKNARITVVLVQEENPVAAGIYILSVKKGKKLSKRSIVAMTKEFMTTREVVLTYDIVAGEVYCLLCSAYEEGVENKCKVVVHTTKEFTIWKPLK
eukprot:TRINITY_DN3448_c0_g1_i4.p1 TRINITY_DN3448_c0_g1~~TRINITY_DN3448_c0_g1_i4.p1  ORF type:complete len:1316 (-),score=283.41 TRINITY_DN3448_c0_g1_i4:149-4096(-)